MIITEMGVFKRCSIVHNCEVPVRRDVHVWAEVMLEGIIFDIRGVAYVYIRK